MLRQNVIVACLALALGATPALAQTEPAPPPASPGEAMTAAPMGNPTNRWRDEGQITL
jgi:hypothetical protein